MVFTYKHKSERARLWSEATMQEAMTAVNENNISIRSPAMSISDCDIDVFSDTNFTPSSVTNWEDGDKILEVEALDILPDMNTKVELSHTPPLDTPASEFVTHNTENESHPVVQDLSTE
ncbi:hypothetical protein ILUMI_17004, partial [Ignelater luminosus]